MNNHLPWNEILKNERLLRSWSQPELASRVNSDSKTVARWEKGTNQPQPYHKQKLMDLFGKTAAELGWITYTRREDWGEAPGAMPLWGRAAELTTARHWIGDEGCRVLAVLGPGGIGKTSFARTLAEELKEGYEAVFWRSLQNIPPVTDLLTTCLHFLRPDQASNPPEHDALLTQLLACLRERRCLLILDNVESLLQSGATSGHYLPGYEEYSRLFVRLGESAHQSCLILTSREKPRELALLDSEHPYVHSLALNGLAQNACEQLLQHKHLTGSEELWSTFVELYAGNPLALKLISDSISSLFEGQIARFLEEEELLIGDLYALLDQQFQHLPVLEQELMYWLAIKREALSRQEMTRLMRSDVPKRALLEAFSSLARRFLLEMRPQGHFVLLPAVQEYVTEHLVEQVYEEILHLRMGLLKSHALIEAQAMDYVRQSQEHFILSPLLTRLVAHLGQEGSIGQFKALLQQLHQEPSAAPGYAGGNLLNLLLHLQADLQGTDFSRLTVRQAYLQGTTLRNAHFEHADLSGSVFTDTFSSMLCVAVSPNGELLAGGTTTDEVRMWTAETLTPLFTCAGHVDGIRQVTFSPDNQLLASASEDETIRIWHTMTGECLFVLRGHTRMVRSIAFRADGRFLASASEDRTIRLWDVHTGECVRILQGHTHWVRAIAFCPVNTLLVSGGDDATLRLWESETGQCLRSWPALSQPRSLAFEPGSQRLACGHEDHLVRLWDIQTGLCLQTFQGHTHRVRSVAFTSNGQLLASGGDDTTIRLWSVEDGQCQRVLQGHQLRVWSIAFVPSTTVLVSVSDDDTLRYWQTKSGQLLRTRHSYSSLIKAIAFSPDGRYIASGSEDRLLRIWDRAQGRCSQVLTGHIGRIRAVDWSAVQQLIVTASEDETVRVWSASNRQCLAILRGHSHLVRAVAFHPTANVLASGGFDQTVRIWDLNTGTCLHILRHQSLVWDVAFDRGGKLLASSDDAQDIHLWDVLAGTELSVLRGHTHKVCALAFSPVDERLVSVSDDQTVRIWNSATFECLHVLHGHSQWIRSVSFCCDGKQLASGSHDQTIRLWDVESGTCLAVLSGHSSRVCSLAFHPTNPALLASASDDGTIKGWDTSSGACIQTLQDERPYEGTDITHATGLSLALKTSLKQLGAIEKD